MPLSPISPDRISFDGSITALEVEQLAADPSVRVVQVSSPVDERVWGLLNESLFSRRTDVTLRLFGFYSSDCDLSFLPQLPNVQRFCADCLRRAKHVECVASLPNLRELSIGIYELDHFDFLDDVAPANLTSLSLEATKSKKPSLALLPRFQQLQSLYLEGQQKSIESISLLPALERLTLRSITIPSLNFICGLKRLWALEIKLGGTNNLKSLEGMIGVKYLELWQIKDLRSIDVVSTMFGLQYLFLQSLPHITSIPDLAQLIALRRVYLESMKGLNDLCNLANAPALEELIHVAASGLDPAHYHHILQNKKLKRLLVGFGSDKKNKALRELAAEAGIDEFKTSEFVFTKRLSK